MSVDRFEEFLVRIKEDDKFATEYFSLRRDHPQDSADVLYKVVLPFAKENGFDFTPRDILEYFFHDEKTKLSDDDLEKVTGGNLKMQTLKLLASLQVVSFLPSYIVPRPVIESFLSSTKEKSKKVDASIQKSKSLISFLDSNPDLPPIDENHPYNEIDAVLFSNIVYLPLNFVPRYGTYDSQFTINDFANILIPYLKGDVKNMVEGPIVPEEAHTVEIFKKSMLNESSHTKKQHDVIKVLEFMSNSRRYKDIKISDSYCKFEKKLQVGSIEQFAAATFTIKDDLKIIAIRGTDDTLSGWKENIDLAWSNNVQSQQHAFAYVGGISNLYPDSKISVVGHSKGGHLATYSALHICDKFPSIKDRIINVYNFDGPGIREDILEEHRNSYNNIKSKIVTFIPQTSIIGVLLNNNNEKDGGVYKYVQSENKFIMQHDTFSWRVSPTCMEKGSLKFVPPMSNSTDKTSKVFENALRDVLSKFTYQEIHIFSDALFKVFGYKDPDAVLFSETVKGNLKNSRIFYNLINLSKEEINVFTGAIGTTILSLIKSANDVNSQEINPVVNKFSTTIDFIKLNNKTRNLLSRKNLECIHQSEAIIAMKLLSLLLNLLRRNRRVYHV